MFNIFKKQKPVWDKEQSAARDKMAGLVASRIIKVQISWSVWMNKKFKTLSSTQKKLILGISGAVMCLYCGYLIISSLTTVITVKEFPVTLTTHSGIHGLPQQTQSEPDSGILDKLVAFENYMSNLNKTVDGKIERSKILTSHPGLMDSLQTLRRYYENNK